MEVKEREDIAKELQGIKEELTGIKRKGAKQVFSKIIAIILSLVIGCGCGFFISQNWNDIMLRLKPGTVAQEKITLISEKIEKEAKLLTAKDTITSKYDSGKIYKTVLGKKVPLTSKSFSFSYTGTVEAGIKDLSKVKVGIDPQNQIVTISLPKVEITNISLDTKNFNSSEQSKNFFNQITLQDFNDAQEQMKKSMKEQAEKSKILDKATKGAEEALKVMLAELTEGFQVQFEWQ